MAAASLVNYWLTGSLQPEAAALVQITNVKLQHFKNYREVEFAFSGNITALVGKNGSGKTNVLDAIHYLSFSKSATNNTDLQNVLTGENFFWIEGVFENSNRNNTIRCSFDGKKKKLSEDGNEYNRFSEHVGKYPVVLIAPQDINLVWEGGEGRRKFFDQWLSQTNRQYLDYLVQYQQNLKQRNSLLRQAQQGAPIDADLLDTYNQPLALAAQYLHQARKTFIEEINPAFAKEYAALVQAAELVSIRYHSDLDTTNPEVLLTENLDQEIAAGRTLAGIHLDDYHFMLHDFEVRKFGSQGQQKSFLVALKWTEISHTKLKRGIFPIVMLDDIFDKMDDNRINSLLHMMAALPGSQFFITDANPHRTRDIFKKANLTYQEVIIGNQ